MSESVRFTRAVTTGTNTPARGQRKASKEALSKIQLLAENGEGRLILRQLLGKIAGRNQTEWSDWDAWDAWDRN